MTADVKREVQFVMALVGAAALLGSIAGAAFGWASSADCWCCAGLENDDR